MSWGITIFITKEWEIIQSYEQMILIMRELHTLKKLRMWKIQNKLSINFKVKVVLRDKKKKNKIYEN